jgi:hypothetical protein
MIADYDLGYKYGVKMYVGEETIGVNYEPTDIAAKAMMFATYSQTQASLAFSAGMCDAAIALAQA